MCFTSAIIFSSLPILTFALPPYLVEVGFDETAITAMESSGTASVCLFAMSENPIEVTVMVVTTTTGTATGRIYHIISDYSKLHTWKSSNYLLRVIFCKQSVGDVEWEVVNEALLTRFYRFYSNFYFTPPVYFLPLL